MIVRKCALQAVDSLRFPSVCQIQHTAHTGKLFIVRSADRLFKKLLLPVCVRLRKREAQFGTACCCDLGMAKFEYMQRAFSSELKPRARLVLQVLVLHCNKEGECFPSIKTIAAKCGYGVSTVKRALDELVKAGYIVKQARFDERKNGGQTSNLYTLCSDLLCPDEPENAPVLEDDASDESPAVQPESAPADACNASDPTPGEQSATLPTADSYSFADGFETKIGRQFCRPIRMWTGGQSIFIPP